MKGYIRGNNIKRKMTKKQSYPPPRCETLILSFEGVIAQSFNFNGFDPDEKPF